MKGYKSVLTKTNALCAEHAIVKWDRYAVSTARKCFVPTKFKDSIITTTLGKQSRVQCEKDLRIILNQIVGSYGVMTSASVFLATPRAANVTDADVTKMVETLNVSGSVLGVAAVKEHELALFMTHLDIKESKGAKCNTLLKVLDVCPANVTIWAYCLPCL